MVVHTTRDGLYMFSLSKLYKYTHHYKPLCSVPFFSKMATNLDVDYLVKDELFFEIRSRGIEVGGDTGVDELRKTLRSNKDVYAHGKALGYLGLLVPDSELKICEDKLVKILSTSHSSTLCKRKCLATLNHITRRLDKIVTSIPEQQSSKLELLVKVQNALKNIACSSTSSEKVVAPIQNIDGVETLPPADSNGKGTLQIFKWKISFDGKSPLHDFLFSLEDYRRSTGIADSELLRNFGHLLVGEPLFWCRNNCEDISSYSMLLAALKEEFLPVDF